MPAIDGYVNAGYDQILYAFTQLHIDMGTVFVSLKNGKDVPLVPDWTHDAIADYATYLMYRNGNTQKQSRGQMYLQNFRDIYDKCFELRSKIKVDMETGAITIVSMKPKQFYNVFEPFVNTNSSDPFSE